MHWDFQCEFILRCVHLVWTWFTRNLHLLSRFILKILVPNRSQMIFNFRSCHPSNYISIICISLFHFIFYFLLHKLYNYSLQIYICDNIGLKTKSELCFLIFTYLLNLVRKSNKRIRCQYVACSVDKVESKRNGRWNGKSIHRSSPVPLYFPELYIIMLKMCFNLCK